MTTEQDMADEWAAALEESGDAEGDNVTNVELDKLEDTSTLPSGLKSIPVT